LSDKAFEGGCVFLLHSRCEESLERNLTLQLYVVSVVCTPLSFLTTTQKQLELKYKVSTAHEF